MKKAARFFLLMLALIMLVSCAFEPKVQKFHVTYFDGDGNKTVDQDYNKGYIFYLPSLNPEMCKIVDQNGKEWAPSAGVTIESDMTFREVWTYTVWVDGEKMMIPSGDFELPIPEKKGQELLKIVRSSDHEVVWKQGDDPVTVHIDRDESFSYIWDSFCILTFKDNEHAPIRVTPDSSFQMPYDITKEGFALKSMTGSDGKSYKPGDWYEVSSDIVLTCEWVKTYKYSLNGVPTGTLREDEEYNYSLLISKPDHRITDLKVNGKPVADPKSYFCPKIYAPAEILDITFGLKKVWTLHEYTPNGHYSRSVDDGSVYTVKKSFADNFKNYRVTGVRANDAYGHPIQITDNEITINQYTEVHYEWVEQVKISIKHYLEDLGKEPVYEKTDVILHDINTPYTFAKPEREGYYLTVEIGGKEHHGNTVDKVTGDMEISFIWKPLMKLTCVNGSNSAVIYADRNGNVKVPSYDDPSSMDTAIVTGSDEKIYREGQDIKLDKDLKLTWTWKTFSLGDTGPAGGTIIMVDERNEYDWKYMEIDSREKGYGATNFGYYLVDNHKGYYDYYTAVRKANNTAFGTGKANTEKLSCMTGSTTTMEYNSSGSAPSTVQFVSWTGDTYVMGGLRYMREHSVVDDWFIPSKDELLWIYENAVKTNLIKIPTENPVFWTSSECLSESNPWEYVWTVDLKTGFVQETRRRYTYGHEPYLRAIRTF